MDGLQPFSEYVAFLKVVDITMVMLQKYMDNLSNPIIQYEHLNQVKNVLLIYKHFIFLSNQIINYNEDFSEHFYLTTYKFWDALYF